jgi:hypothetical protein
LFLRENEEHSIRFATHYLQAGGPFIESVYTESSSPVVNLFDPTYTELSSDVAAATAGSHD